jgi:hypothetical protein
VRLDGPLTLRQLFQGLIAYFRAPIDRATLRTLLAEGWFELMSPQDPPPERFELLEDHVYVEIFKRRGPGAYHIDCGS